MKNQATKNNEYSNTSHTSQQLVVPHTKSNREEINTLLREITEEISKYKATYGDKITDKATEDFCTLIDRLTRKPKIAFIGRPDSGKSTAINTLIARYILPANWTPTTSSYVILKHIEDTPAYMEENHVIVFRESESFDPDKYNDENHCMEYLVEMGDYELISKYGEHNDLTDENESKIGAIIAFVDSELLYNCDFVDLPGFNPNGYIVSENGSDVTVDRDTLLSAKASRMADGFVYLSIANSFLYGDDLTMAQSILKGLPIIERKDENALPPFANVFFVASQANAVDHGNKEKLDRICKNASKRLWALVAEHPAISVREKQTGYHYDENTLRTRFFTSEIESQELTQDFYNAFVAFIEVLPAAQLAKTLELLCDFCDSQMSILSDKIYRYQTIMADHTHAAKNMDNAKALAPHILSGFQEKAERIKSIVLTMKQESRKECARIYDEVIDTDHIKNIINKYRLKSNKRDAEQLVAILNAELENRITDVLSKKAELLKKETDSFLDECQAIFDIRDVTDQKTSKLMSTMNVESAFVGGLSGIATIGAMAAWATACGNLGGYIIVAKAVGLLSSLGIHLGGAAAVVSAVSAIGGPIVFGIAAAILSAIGAMLIFNGSWKQRLAGKLKHRYNESNIKFKLIEASDKYWDDTLTALDAGINGIKTTWDKNIAEQDEMLVNFDITDYESKKEKSELTVCLWSAVKRKISRDYESSNELESNWDPDEEYDINDNESDDIVICGPEPTTDSKGNLIYNV